MFSDRIKLQLDGNKLLHHLDAVESWIEGKEFYPIYIAFSPSSLCNHSCVFCVYQHKKFEPIYFPLDRYQALVDEWAELGVKSVFFAGDGDPLLNKNCVEMARYTREKGIDIAINTNGRVLNEEKCSVLVDSLDWIRFSVNAGTAQTYAKVHGSNASDFSFVLNNIATMVRLREKTRVSRRIKIGMQCVLLEENQHEIETLAKTAKEIGADYLAVKPFLKHPLTEYNSQIKNPSEVMKRLRKLDSLTDSSFTFALRQTLFSENPRSYRRCLAGPFMIEIDAKGDVYNCGPYLGNADHCYGNVLKTSFKEMWNSERKAEVMRRIQEKLDVGKCMPSCRPDSVNRFLWEIKNPPEHVNYI